MPVELFIERVEPMSVLSFRWHPCPPKDGDTSKLPTTPVTFELAAAQGGTLLGLSESGFDLVPIERRARAFTDKEGGWEISREWDGALARLAAFVEG